MGRPTIYSLEQGQEQAIIIKMMVYGLISERLFYYCDLALRKCLLFKFWGRSTIGEGPSIGVSTVYELFQIAYHYCFGYYILMYLVMLNYTHSKEEKLLPCIHDDLYFINNCIFSYPYWQIVKSHPVDDSRNFPLWKILHQLQSWDLLKGFDFSCLPLVLIEGFKTSTT